MNHSENSDCSENQFSECSLRAPIYFSIGAEQSGVRGHSARSRRQARIRARKHQYGQRPLTFAEIRKIMSEPLDTGTVGKTDKCQEVTHS
jgi:hypothetical protein